MASANASRSLPEIDPSWAWAEYVPDEQRPWDLRRAAHLLRRAACGADWETLQSAVEAGPRQTIDRLLSPDSASVEAFEQMMREDEASVARTGGIESLRAWWLRRIVRSPHPLQEKITLVWHSHFGVGQSRVNDAQLMLSHVQTLRQHSLGSYRALMETMVVDPAALLNAGPERNSKMQPIEGFARLLLARYSVGPGQFSEEDVRAAARALTGWTVLRGRLRFLAHDHDDGSKTLLGQTGNWDAQDVVRIALDQPATARWIAGTLYRALVSETDTPSDAVLEPLAALLRPDYQVQPVVETILRSNLFHSADVYRRRVKSPVEFAVGIVRGLTKEIATLPLGAAVAGLGQDLYNPPTVDGWAGGTHWLNPVTMLQRAKLAEALFSAQGPYAGQLEVAAAAAVWGHATPSATAEWLLQLYLQDDVTSETRAALLDSVTDSSGDSLRDCAASIVTLPEFQLC